jgi:hypothetical protein
LHRANRIRFRIGHVERIAVDRDAGGLRERRRIHFAVAPRFFARARVRIRLIVQ